jgi:hypothetical protein
LQAGEDGVADLPLQAAQGLFGGLAFGQDRAIGPGQVRPGIVLSQDRDLVPQCEHLRVLRRRRPSQQGEPGQHLNKDPTGQANGQDRRSSDVTIAQVKLDGRILGQDNRFVSHR